MKSRRGSDKCRRDKRLNITTKCRLDISGKVHDCIVDNISTVGAAIDITNLKFSKKNLLQVGEMGTLNVLLLAPVKFHCKVVWVSSTQIGVEFINSIP